MQKGVKRKKKMENIQAPWIGKPEDEWEDPDEYFNAHGGEGTQAIELFAREHVEGWDCWGDEV